MNETFLLILIIISSIFLALGIIYDIRETYLLCKYRKGTNRIENSQFKNKNGDDSKGENNG